MWTESWTRRLPLSPGTLEEHLIWGVLGTAHGLLTADVDGRVTLFGADGEATVLGSHDGPARRLIGDPLGRTPLCASSGDDFAVRLWDPASGRGHGVLRGHDGVIHSLAMGVHKGRVLVLSASADLTAIVWDIATTRPRRTLRGHRDAVYCARFLASGLAATGGEDGTVRVWDLDDDSGGTVLHGHTAPVGALAADGPHLLSGSDDGEVIGWDLARSRPHYRIRAHDGWVHDIALHRDLAATTGDRLVRVWHAGTGRPVLSLEGHAGPTTKVRFARLDGRDVLVTSAEDLRIRAWDLADGSEVDGVPTTAEGALFDLGADGRLAVGHGPRLSLHTRGSDRITDTEQEARAT
ncbi:WD40 repeat domain-containing protein [Phytomonospora endophytica]|uniref:WD40 repeat protein n=1 Tax=Phytomonospora endophytica TaxID=714109 RepID=A0A841FUE3_9ACTN|nr:WD40 repeat domain-containing protein [Phytomonospora endophytica]MBB6039626.1 WD40 repeat protein [Phytomonospora endophytica]GIG65655.1 hypothetical protein Pen01_19500 [Phytomonospora endophytica]